MSHTTVKTRKRERHSSVEAIDETLVWIETNEKASVSLAQIVWHPYATTHSTASDHPRDDVPEAIQMYNQA